jgi:hypothetical protein
MLHRVASRRVASRRVVASSRAHLRSYTCNETSCVVIASRSGALDVRYPSSRERVTSSRSSVGGSSRRAIAIARRGRAIRAPTRADVELDERRRRRRRRRDARAREREARPRMPRRRRDAAEMRGRATTEI